MRHSRSDTVAGMEIVVGSCLRAHRTDGLFLVDLFAGQGVLLSFEDTATYGLQF